MLLYGRGQVEGLTPNTVLSSIIFELTVTAKADLHSRLLRDTIDYPLIPFISASIQSERQYVFRLLITRLPVVSFYQFSLNITRRNIQMG